MSEEYVLTPLSDLQDMADVVRDATGITDTMTVSELSNAVINTIISGTSGGGIDTSDATATTNDILSGKTAYVDGEKITGIIETKTSSDLSVSEETVTVPAGYYASQATKSVSTATQATPIISVNASGLITASTTQTAGYVSAGTKSVTKQLATQETKIITPSASSQTAVASGVYTIGDVTVVGDINLKAENIAEGVSIFGIEGSHTGGTDTSDATATANEILQGETAYVNGEKITGTIETFDGSYECSGESTGEDVTDEINVYTEKLATLETAITALETELEGKTSGGGAGVATCTIEIVNETIGHPFLESYVGGLWFVAYENGVYKGYGGYQTYSDTSILPVGFDWYAEKITLNNVVCGSMMCIYDAQATLTAPSVDWYINSNVDSSYFLIPSTPNVIHTLKMSAWG